MFTINLASENVAVSKRMRLAMQVLSVVAALLLVWTVLTGVFLQRQLGQERLRAAQSVEQQRAVEARLRQNGLVLTPEVRNNLIAQVQVANEVNGRRRFQWSQLFRDMEEAMPWGVALTGIQPQPAASTIVLRGAALTEAQLTGATGLLRGLEASKRFHHVELVDQKAQADGTVGFTLNVQY